MLETLNEPVPIRALWPPLTLIGLDLVLMLLSLALGYTVIAVLLAVGFLLLVFDIRGRMVDYRTVLMHLRRGRHPERVAKAYQFSWCGRVACQHAAGSICTDTARTIRSYYEDSGYRWYNVFPDNTFSLKCPFLTLRFWEVTLFGNSRIPEKVLGADDTPDTAPDRAFEPQTPPLQHQACDDDHEARGETRTRQAIVQAA